MKPLHEHDPGRRDLQERIRESGDRAAENVDHVLAVARAEALAKNTVEYLTGRMFEADSWRKKLGMRVDDARRSLANGSRAGPRSARDEPDEPKPSHLKPMP